MSLASKISRHLLPWAFAASFAVHFFFFVVKPYLSGLTSDESPEQIESAPIELTQLPPSAPAAPMAQAEPAPQAPPKIKEKKEWEMAESAKADNDKLDPNAKILSDKTQTAEEQMRAKLVDDFRDKTGTGLKAAEGTNEAEAPPTGDPLEGVTAKSDLEVADSEAAAEAQKNRGIKRDWRKLSLKDLSVGGDGGLAAASDDHLADLKTGDRTILSTREYKYFSYYQRIKDLLRQHWKPTVERKLQRLWEKGKPMGEEEVTTRLLVLLSPDGKIQKISRMLSSGVVELDQAAMEAFERAGPFPNPPKGIVDEDGFVRIKWDFILKTETSPRIQFSSAGRGVR